MSVVANRQAGRATWKRSMVGLGCRHMPVSKLPDIVGPCVEFAEMVRAITGDVPRQTAANHAGVSHDTIARMWRGEQVKEPVIIRFATGYQVNPNPLLIAAGFQPIRIKTTEDDGANRELIRTIDPRGPEMAEAWEGLPEPLRSVFYAGILESSREHRKSHPLKGVVGGSGTDLDEQTEIEETEYLPDEESATY